MKNGIVYIAFRGSNKNIIKELRSSVASVKNIHPDLPVTLFTNSDPNIKAIDDVKIIKPKGERVKQDILEKTPYENTLYLDTDTNIMGDIKQIFDLMGRFDLAAVPDGIRKSPKHAKRYPDYADIPEGFPEFGGGVILFRDCVETHMFFETWRRNYDKWYGLTKETRDQPSFRVSLWQCGELNFYSLPPEYNYRTKKYNNIKTRILHEHNLWRR